jgi:hypothetical protein
MQEVLYAEGTRQTPEKRDRSIKYCQDNNLPVFKVGLHHGCTSAMLVYYCEQLSAAKAHLRACLQHVMYPRVKGYVVVMEELHKHGTIAADVAGKNCESSILCFLYHDLTGVFF